MKTMHLLLLSLVVLLVFSGFYSVKDISTTGANFYYLTSSKWDLMEVEVAGYSYTDSLSTSMELKFNGNGTFRLGNDTTNVPWLFQDATQEKIVISPGTPEQQIWNIKYLNIGYLVYDWNYTLNDSTYNYIFRFKGTPVTPGE